MEFFRKCRSVVAIAIILFCDITMRRGEWLHKLHISLDTKKNAKSSTNVSIGKEVWQKRLGLPRRSDGWRVWLPGSCPQAVLYARSLPLALMHELCHGNEVVDAAVDPLDSLPSVSEAVLS